MTEVVIRGDWEGAIQRFFGKFEADPNSGCWLWTAALVEHRPNMATHFGGRMMETVVVIRGDWEGMAVYLEKPDSVEPGECIGVFNTLTGAARAAAAAKQAVAELHAMRRNLTNGL